MTQFCNNNKTLPLRITVKHSMNHGDHKVYGQMTTSAKEIEMQAVGDELDIKDSKGKKVGNIAFN